ncbi:MAG: hypothetical protein H0U74_21180 [Bradymonadaceae bacterium]|nr:hypothetical protein [Lujinxingiaceae bacterium]
MVETIDAMVLEHYPFAKQKGIDLRVFSNQLRNLPLDELEDDQFLVELARAVALLRDGHTRIERYHLEQLAEPALSLREADDGLVYVSHLKAKGLGLLVGDRIDTIDGVAAAQYLEARRALPSAWHQGQIGHIGVDHMGGAASALAGPAGTSVVLGLAQGHEITLDRRNFFSEPVARRLPGNVGYIDIATFGFIDDLDRLDTAINDLMDSRALIIDLRGNGGGYPSVTDGLFGRLIAEDVAAFDMVAADGTHKRTIGPTPRGKTYDGEVVILTDGMTFSASNYLAQRLVYHKRGVLVGERTGGGSASPEQGLLLVPGIWFQVSTYVLQTPEGVNAEDGLEPQVAVSFSSDEIVNGLATKSAVVGKDKVLDEAIRFLKEKR